MDVELTRALQGRKKQLWQAFLERAGLEPDDRVDSTVLVWEDDEIIATGSRTGNLLKCIAVDDLHQGEGLTGTLLTQLRQDAFKEGHSHLFLYTKPKNKFMFSSLFFYPIAQTSDVLLMENKKNGLQEFLATLSPVPCDGTVGAAVMNCNPFTKGHRYLIETAAKACDRLYVFVLSEDRSYFSAEDRMNMVKLGVADLTNVVVIPGGRYAVSSLTFPSYFTKEENLAKAHTAIDAEIFCRHIAPALGAKHRFLGTEPLSAVTNVYNETLKERLPRADIEVTELTRLEKEEQPVSASRVRGLLGESREALVNPSEELVSQLSRLVPATTLDYLLTKVAANA